MKAADIFVDAVLACAGAALSVLVAFAARL